MTTAPPRIRKKLMTRRRLIVAGILTALVAGFVLFSDYGLFTRLSLQSDVSQLIVLRESLIMKSDSLRNMIRRLETDTTLIERIARERYGYVRKGETVYIIEEEK